MGGGIDPGLGRTIRVSVAGEVQCGEIVAECQGDGVVGVSVLRTAVQQHDPRGLLTPEEPADRPTIVEDGRGAPNDGSAVEHEPPLVGVLVEEPQLVVVHCLHMRNPRPQFGW